MSLELNAKIAELFEIKARRAERAKVEKTDKTLQDNIEAEIRQMVIDLDVPKYTSNLGTVTPTQREFVQVNDMQAFLAYVDREGSESLLNIKPAQAATLEQIRIFGDAVDGVEIGFKNTLSARAL